MKTYTITVADDEDVSAIKRAMMADSMAHVIFDLDEMLRAVTKWSDKGTDIEYAEKWRDELRELAADNGIIIGSLWE